MVCRKSRQSIRHTPAVVVYFFWREARWLRQRDRDFDSKGSDIELGESEEFEREEEVADDCDVPDDPVSALISHSWQVLLL